MRTIEDIIIEISSLNPPSEPFDDYYRISDELASHVDGAKAIPAILRLFERFPIEDFGAPGPLAHAIETFLGKGYEQTLLDSLRRCPTIHTCSLAMAAANGSMQFRKELHDTLLQISNSVSESDPIRQHITEYFLLLQNIK